MPKLQAMPTTAKVLKVLAALIMLGGTVYLSIRLSTHAVPQENRELLFQMVGGLMTASAAIVSALFSQEQEPKKHKEDE